MMEWLNACHVLSASIIADEAEVGVGQGAGLFGFP